MKFIKTLLATAALAVSASAFATPVTVGGAEQPDLQAAINALYTAAGTNVINAPNVNLNQANEVGQFTIEASGGSIATMVIEVAGMADTNRFGIYDLNNPGVFLELFAGGATAGKQATLSVEDVNLFSVNYGAAVQFSSSAFGYYLATGSGDIFYSQAVLNGGDDHMVAFQGDGDKIKLPTRPAGVWGTSSFILAWEDQALAGSDKDYNDFVVYVESVTAVPEPGSLALLGLGLAGLAAASRRKQKQA